MSRAKTKKNTNSPSRLSSLKNIEKKVIKFSQAGKLKSFSISHKDDVIKRGNEPLVFSFAIFSREHKAFNLGDLKKVCEHWFIELFDSLKKISNYTWVDVQREGTFRAHPLGEKINFEFDFDEQTLEQYDSAQLCISSSTKGRIHGFIVGNVFYIYWLDPHHNMYDSPGRPPVYFPKTPALNCCEKQNEIIEKLTKENNKLKQDIDDLLAQ